MRIYLSRMIKTAFAASCLSACSAAYAGSFTWSYACPPKKGAGEGFNERLVASTVDIYDIFVSSHNQYGPKIVFYGLTLSATAKNPVGCTIHNTI